jgi:RHS repeat-associated protein
MGANRRKNRAVEQGLGTVAKHGTASAHTSRDASSYHEHDDNGNLIGDETYTFAYDFANHLVKVVRQSDSKTIGQYTYDALGRRVKKVVDDVNDTLDGTRLFYYDGLRVIEQGELDGSNNYAATHQYVWGLYLDELLVYDYDDDADGNFDAIDQQGGDKRYYALQDFIYSTAALINSSGTVQERYEYEPYGTPTLWSADYSDTRPLTTGTCWFLFTGQMYDPETGLYHYKARAVHPLLGRFLQRDAVLADLAGIRYAYGVSAPLNHTDSVGAVPERQQMWARPLPGALCWIPVRRLRQYRKTTRVFYAYTVCDDKCCCRVQDEYVESWQIDTWELREFSVNEVRYRIIDWDVAQCQAENLMLASQMCDHLVPDLWMYNPLLGAYYFGWGRAYQLLAGWRSGCPDTGKRHTVKEYRLTGNPQRKTADYVAERWERLVHRNWNCWAHGGHPPEEARTDWPHTGGSPWPEGFGEKVWWAAYGYPISTLDDYNMGWAVPATEWSAGRGVAAAAFVSSLADLGGVYTGDRWPTRPKGGVRFQWLMLGQDCGGFRMYAP